MSDTPKIISAEEARHFSGRTVGEKVQSIGKRIEELAKEGKRQLRCGYDYNSDAELWLNGGYSQTEDWKQAVGILKSFGYQVEFHYEEWQFVDMYTLISW